MGGPIDPQVIVATISTIGGIIIAYLAIVAARYKNKTGKILSRKDFVYDGYESLILAYQEDSRRKSEAISSLEDTLNNVEQELRTARLALESAKSDNAVLKRQIDALQAQIKRR